MSELRVVQNTGPVISLLKRIMRKISAQILLPKSSLINFETCFHWKSSVRQTQKYSLSKCLLRHDVVRVFVSSLVLVFVLAILSWCPKTWHIYIVYNILCLNISSIYILIKTFTYVYIIWWSYLTSNNFCITYLLNQSIFIKSVFQNQQYKIMSCFEVHNVNHIV